MVGGCWLSKRGFFFLCFFSLPLCFEERRGEEGIHSPIRPITTRETPLPQSLCRTQEGTKKEEKHRHPRPFAPNKVGSKGKKKKNREGEKEKKGKIHHLAACISVAMDSGNSLGLLSSLKQCRKPSQKPKSTFFFPFSTHTHHLSLFSQVHARAWVFYVMSHSLSLGPDYLRGPETAHEPRDEKLLRILSFQRGCLGNTMSRWKQFTDVLL